MKINDIASVIRKSVSKEIDFFETPDGTQWVSTDKVFYPLYGMPTVDEDSLPLILSIPAKDIEKYVIRHVPCPTEYSFSDYEDGEKLIEKAELVSIGFGGQVLYPAETSSVLKFYDPMYIKPVKENFELFERVKSDGSIYLAVKAGLALIAVIEPEVLDEKDMARRLRKLAEELEGRAADKTRPELKEVLLIDKGTGEILEESICQN